MSHKPIVGFVHIPKTGGTTVKFILRNSTYLRHSDLQPLVRRGIFDGKDFQFMKKVFFFGLHTIAGHSLRSSAGNFSTPIQYFTIVRDPLRRCLSHYQHTKRAYQRVEKDISFEEFMQEESFNDCQVRRIAGEPNLEKAIEELTSRYFFVGLLERFAESMLILQKLCPYPLILEYKRLHVTKDNTAKEEVLNNPAFCEILREGNRLDLALYAFVHDKLFPSFREKAGPIAQEVDEKEFQPSSYPIRYRITRFYNQAIYRNLNKLRRGVKRCKA